jgi:tight adherence protein C
MSGILGIPFGLGIAEFNFGPVETVLLVVAVATALVSLFELIRLPFSESLQARAADLRHAIIESGRPVRAARIRWYVHLGNILGAILAQSPLVGTAEQRRLMENLSLAGFDGPRWVTSFIAIRFPSAVVAGVVVAILLSPVEMGDAGPLRYFLVAFGVMLGWRLPDLLLRRLARRRKIRLEVGFPDALDLLVICTEAGLGLEQALSQVAHDLRYSTPDIASEFAITAAEMRVDADRRVALEHLAARTGLDTLQGMISILNQSVRFGTSLAESLRQLSAEARTVRMYRLEERGARLGVTLLLPVVAFIVPCLFLVFLGPITLRAIDTFSAMVIMQDHR